MCVVSMICIIYHYHNDYIRVIFIEFSRALIGDKTMFVGALPAGFLLKAVDGSSCIEQPTSKCYRIQK